MGGRRVSSSCFATTRAKPPRGLLSLVTYDLWGCLGYLARDGAAGPWSRPQGSQAVYLWPLQLAPPLGEPTSSEIHPGQQVVLSDFLTFANLVGANGISLLF